MNIFIKFVEMIAVISTVFILTGIANAAIIVPDDYATIQWAIDNATAGDTIIVRDGFYVENIVVNKPLTVKSEDGFANCIIKAEFGNIVAITANHVTLTGFTLIGVGRNEFLFADISVNANYCEISDNLILNNDIGVRLYYSNNNIIKNNNITGNIFGIRLYRSNDNLIYLNNLINSRNVYSQESVNLWNSTKQVIYQYNDQTFVGNLGNNWSDCYVDRQTIYIGDLPLLTYQTTILLMMELEMPPI